MCKVTPYLQGVSVCASVNMLAAIAADRYLAICFTLEHKMTWKIAKVIVCIIWLISGVIMLPWLLYHEQEKYIDTGIQTFYICTQRWPDKEGPRMFFVAIFILCYAIPLLLIILCYSLIAVRVWNRNAPGIIRYNSVIQKSKVKVVKMLFMVVILFAASWLPLYIIFLVVYFFSPDPGSNTYEILYNSLVPLSQWLGLSNSGMNPIIYFYFSKTIRKRTMALLSCSRSVDNGAYYRRYSSTRCVSVDYTNGQIILRMNNRSLNRSQKVVDSTFYD
ncbi:hypothetical protein ACJMK2_034118 [Sinanodonta woodiana]|uniref:G-protein coupled receptors family 1 profile domain-containing protein n=1 Tax=Sinanodonta woodiana TaxID=1069815 RepID=A0ABD3WUS0_SINWO